MFKIFNSKKKELNLSIDKLISMLERSNLSDLAYILGSKREIIKRNILAGIFKGIGIGIGVTVVTAVLVLILQHLVSLNIPVIGKYIADIVEIVEKSR